MLTAKQAAELYRDADVRVLNSKTIGDGYAALTMLDFESNNTNVIEESLNSAMEGVLTGMITQSVRDSSIGGLHIAKNDFIGFVGHDMLADDTTVDGAARQLLGAIDMSDKSVIIAICGKDASASDMDSVRAFVKETYPDTELFEIDGGQDIYHFIFVIE